MYQFSRAIYRELADEIIEDPRSALSQREPRARAARLRGSRRATCDRSPLLRAARPVAVPGHPCPLSDGRAAARAERDRALPGGRRRVPARPGRRAGSTSAATGCSAARAPARARRASGAAAAQRLLPVAPAPRRDRGHGPGGIRGPGARPAVETAGALDERAERAVFSSRLVRDGHANGRDNQRMLLGVDVGGTFTDAVLALDGRIVTAKAPTTPADQSLGVMDAVRAALATARRDAAEMTAFAHGMTVATNALLEGRAARAPRWSRPRASPTSSSSPARTGRSSIACAPPARNRSCRDELPLRGAGADDPGRALASARARPPRAVGGTGRGCEPAAVAVVLLHSYRHPEHERLIGEALAARAARRARVALARGRRHVPRVRARRNDRGRRGAVAAAVRLPARPRERRCEQEGLPEPAIMQSNGGLIDLEAAAGPRRAARSSPARRAAPPERRSRPAPPAPATRSASTWAAPRATSAWSTAATVQEQSSGAIGSHPPRPLALPMLAVHTVGAGGGSIAWRDAGGALRVGPRSAGADPGPACYGRGGASRRSPTRTSCSGTSTARLPLAGGVQLDREAAVRAVGGACRRGSTSRSRLCAPGSAASPAPRWSARCAS